MKEGGGMLAFQSKEEDSNLHAYELKKMAKSLKMAHQLVDERAAYFDSLYDDIIYPSVRIDPLMPGNGNPDTAAQALHIIDCKEAYDARIHKAREQYGRWQMYLKDFNQREAELLVRYFEQGDPIPYTTISRLVERASEIHDSYYEANEKAKDFEAYEEYREHLKVLRESKYTVEPAKTLRYEEVETRQYLIDGKFVEATRDEYEAYREEEREKNRQFDEILSGAIGI